MKNVDGLIQYYYQRRIRGADVEDIRHSLQDQQHIEDDDVELILREVQRKEHLYQKSVSRRRLVKILYYAGIPLLAISLSFLYLNYFNILQYHIAITLGLVALSLTALLTAWFTDRNIRL